MKPSLLIIGLGNPGAQYERTRHNVGFLALDALSKQFGVGNWEDKQKFQSMLQEARVGIAPVLLVKPKTYMNLSGDAVRKLVDYYKLDPSEQVLIIVDDIDIPRGELRLRRKGGAGTHNGLKSICTIYGEDFPRLRIGIGQNPPGTELSNWVLSTFTQEEFEDLRSVFTDLPSIIQTFIMGDS